ncbi:MAG: PqqD family protein [Gammaproteobacteria bacterium]|nr:PqqD family protein [Gammaproteobacteria bacterium]
MNKNIVLRHKSGVRAREVDNELVILDRDNGNINKLNQSACFIWSLLDGTKTVGQVEQALIKEYDIDLETAATDVESVVRRLQELGLLEQ